MRRALLSLAVLAVAPAALADQVSMANGDRLSGTVLRKDGEVVVLRTTYAGEVRLRLADVTAIVTDEPVKLLLEDGTLLRARLGEPAEGETVAPALAHIRYINPTPDEAGDGYQREGRVGLMAAQTRGNSENEQFRGEVDLILRAQTHRWTLGAERNHGRESGETSTSNWRTKARLDRFFTAKEFLYARVTLENDRYKDIRLRSQAGGGYGYQIYEDDATTLDVRGGLSYVTVRHYDAALEDYPAVSWGLDFRHKLRIFAGEVFHVQEGTRGLGSRYGTVLQTKTGLRLPLAERLNATAQVNADWESEPAPGRKEADTTLMLGISYAID